MFKLQVGLMPIRNMALFLWLAITFQQEQLLPLNYFWMQTHSLKRNMNSGGGGEPLTDAGPASWVAFGRLSLPWQHLLVRCRHLFCGNKSPNPLIWVSTSQWDSQSLSCKKRMPTYTTCPIWLCDVYHACICTHAPIGILNTHDSFWSDLNTQRNDSFCTFGTRGFLHILWFVWRGEEGWRIVP